MIFKRYLSIAPRSVTLTASLHLRWMNFFFSLGKSFEKDVHSRNVLPEGQRVRQGEHYFFHFVYDVRRDYPNADIDGMIQIM